MTQDIPKRTFAQAMQEIESTLRAQLLDMPQVDAHEIIQTSQIKRLRMRLQECEWLLLSALDSTPQPDTNQGARYVVEGDFRGMFTIRDLDDYSFLDTEYTDEADAQAACDRLNASTPEAGSGNGGS